MQASTGAVIVITLLAAFALVYWFGRKHGAQSQAALAGGLAESQELSTLSQRLLLGFLLLLAVVLVYVLVALWSVEFPDAHYVKDRRLSQAGAVRPARASLDRAVGSGPGGRRLNPVHAHGLWIQFRREDKVYFNAAERPAQLIKANTLLVSMTPADTAQPGAVTVTVISPSASSSRKLPG